MKQRRRPRLTGRLWRRRRREPVPAGSPVQIFRGLDEDGGSAGGDDWADRGDWRDGGDWGDGGGSAGVREPRRPKPLGPMSGAAEAVPANPPLAAQLPDPRSQPGLVGPSRA